MRINRYIVGCKQVISLYDFIRSSELIDTQWDVNIYQPVGYDEAIPELIDTQWDVN